MKTAVAGVARSSNSAWHWSHVRIATETVLRDIPAPERTCVHVQRIVPIQCHCGAIRCLTYQRGLVELNEFNDADIGSSNVVAEREQAPARSSNDTVAIQRQRLRLQGGFIQLSDWSNVLVEYAVQQTLVEWSERTAALKAYVDLRGSLGRTHSFKHLAFTRGE